MTSLRLGQLTATGVAFLVLYGTSPISAMYQARSNDPQTVEQKKQLDEAHRLWRQAQQFMDRKAFSRAISEAESSLRLLRSLFPPADAEITRELADIARMYARAGNHHQGGILLTEAISLLRDAMPPRLSELAACLHDRAAIYAREQEPEKNRIVLVEEAEILRRVLPSNPNLLIACLMDLATAHAQLQEFDRSAVILQEAIVLLRKSAPTRADDLATCLVRLAQLRLKSGSPEDARPLLEEACQLWRKSSASRPSEHIGSLAALSWIYRKENQGEKSNAVLEQARACARDTCEQAENFKKKAEYSRALSLTREGVEIAHILHSPGHPDIASRLIDLGDLLDFLGNYPEAQSALQSALGILRKAYPGGHRETVRALTVLIRTEDTTEKIDLAKSHLRNVRQLIRGMTEEAPVFVGSTLSELGMYAANLGEQRQALDLMVAGLSILQENTARSDPEQLKALLNLSMLHVLMGKQSREEQLFTVLSDRVKGLPQHHPFQVTFREESVRRLQRASQWAQAEKLCRDTINLAVNILPHNHPDLASLWNRLGMLRVDAGDLRGAEEAFQEAKHIVDETLPRGHPTIATYDFNLGSLYAKVGGLRQKAAKILYQSVLEDLRRVFPADHTRIANALDALASVTDEFHEAEKLSLEAVAILEKRHAYDEIPMKANLATLYANNDEVLKAGKLYRDVQRLAEEVYPPDHVIRLQIREQIFGFFFQTGAIDDAFRLSRESLRRHRLLLERSALFQSERQQLRLISALRGHLDNYLSAAHAQGTPPDEVYNEILAWKGSVTRRQESERHVRLTRGTRGEEKSVQEKITELRNTLQELEALTYAPRPLDRQEQDDRRRTLQVLNDRHEELELDLRQQDALLAPMKWPDSKSVRVALSSQSQEIALVDFLEHQFLVPPKAGVQAQKATRFSAFVVRPMQPVEWVDLGPSEVIRNAIDQWRNAVAQGLLPTNSAAQLRELVWNKIEGHLRGVNIVLVSPDSDLARLPLAALPAEGNGRYLIHDYAFVIITTPAKLPEMLDTAVFGRTDKEANLLLVGNINYDVVPDPGKAPAATDNRTDRRGPHVGPPRRFDPLKNAVGEMNGVKQVFLNAFPGAAVKSLTCGNASRAAYVKEAPLYRWQHLVTHGFFATLPPELKKPGPRFIGDLMVSAGEDPGLWNPALMSGLAFAGANHPSSLMNGGGVLTALSASETDLRNVDLVMLAACETGLGKVADGEGGVLGLQRAFHLAGARSVVASSWRVGDRATHDFSIEFYRNLWDKERKLSKLEAFQKAQRWMIETYKPTKEEQGRGPVEHADKPPLDPKSARPYTQEDTLSPFFWAAFTLSGDWR